jgi:hypothetical protein
MLPPRLTPPAEGGESKGSHHAVSKPLAKTDHPLGKPRVILACFGKDLWDSINRSPDPTCQTRKNGFERGEKKKAPFTEERLHVSIYNFAD